MAIGNQSTYSTSGLNKEIADIAQAMHDAHQQAKEFFERINAFGTAGLIAVGFAQLDAEGFFQVANEMNTDALIWYGQVEQTPPFNFDDATAKAR